LVNPEIYPKGKCLFEMNKEDTSLAWDFQIGSEGIFIFTNSEIIHIEVEEIREYHQWGEKS